MHKLFESFRKYSLLTEEQLLVEGRIDDAGKKYPELAKKREGLDGESVLDTLIQADPSGNQKYLMGAAKLVNASLERAKTDDYEIFWAKKWPTEAERRELPGGGTVTSPIHPRDTDNLVSAWGIARNVAELLPKFHKLQPYISTDKRDIHANATWGEFSTVVATAAQKKRDKEEEKELGRKAKQQAGEESTMVADNDYYTMIRPTTEHASCYYGQGTKWCISATQAGNYFDEYTNEGKSFYFVFFANLSNENKYKKIALVVGMNGEYDEAFDSEDNNLYPREVVDAMVQNMLHEKEDAGALMAYRYYDNEHYVDELTEADKADYVKKIKELNAQGDNLDDCVGRACFKEQAEQANHNIRVRAEKWFHEMKAEAVATHDEDPPGPGEEQFNELLNAYERQATNISISVNFPSETGASGVYWESYAHAHVEEIMADPTVQEQRLRWKIDVEHTTLAQDEEIHEAVVDALGSINIYPEEIEAEYGAPLEFSIRLDQGDGNVDAFDEFVDHTLYIDNQWQESFVDALIEALLEKELIRRDRREEEYWPDPEEKKKQIELPFDIGAEEGAARERAGLRETHSKIRVIIKS